MKAIFVAKKTVQFSVFPVVVFILLYSVAVTAGVVDFSPGLLRHVAAKWGSGAVERLQGWRNSEMKYLRNRKDSPPSATLTQDELQDVNALWNRIPFYSDQEHWGVPDYWATPVEMMSSNGGDCEDYSIAKYFSLKELGIPLESLRITYVRSLKRNEAHMVLAYYPTPDADPYILDNLIGKLTHASERDDLVPVYSFNDEDLWLAGGTSSLKGKSGQIRLWRELLDKMDKERKM